MGTARGRRDVGIIFCENTAISAEGVARGRAFERLIAGSRWNAALLGAAGVDGVRVCWQGVDRTVFHPGPRSGRLRRRFVVFSGGKLEFRKGQDLVLAAFRIFRARHPEALLLTAWYNAWAGPSVGVTRAGLVTSEPPRTADGGLDLFAWAAAEGLPEGSFFDVGQLPNHAFGRLMREADVALFPNRCEGGTNVVAMECLACGVPAVLSANTGHLDLIDQVACYPLREQRPVAPAGPGDGTEGWGESSVEEIVETLECVYRRRDEAAAIGRRAAEQMVAWDWTARADDLLRTAGLA
jgi:glycosyltransferase involved in cell wall biosynthesis